MSGFLADQPALNVRHGWPGSITEQMKISDPLTNPTAHGGKASDAFHVVIPSMPSVAAARIQQEATVVNMISGPQKRLDLSSMPTGDLTGADLIITSGAAAGKSVALGAVTGKTAGFGFGADPAIVNSIQPGDKVRVETRRISPFRLITAIRSRRATCMVGGSSGTAKASRSIRSAASCSGRSAQCTGQALSRTAGSKAR